ncbi:response regulator [Allomeiothermus silvanus]|uniref:response regulator n=1 Tax=Allomeiothermus silvanus TaxID=52022 RepID=UPI0023F35852|nr:response regulator transcription factor [Allomeiothermus silvanus]
MNPKVRVLLVDDHGVVRQGMKLYLATDSSIEVVGEAKNGQEALTQVEKLEPDVVIMDLLMPVMDGISAIREIKKRFPEVEIVAVTSVLEDKKVVDAVQAGAMGYLLKDTDAAALSEAIHAASRGEVRLHPEAAKRLMREVRTPDMRESLTPRETEILKLLAQGHSNKHIARETGVEERTVKAHVSSILAKLGLSSRTQAALFALKEGLVG